MLFDDQLEMKKQETIEAAYDDIKEFIMDDKGYFLIRINNKENCIEIAHCYDINKIDYIIKGKKPIEVYQTAIKKGLITRLDHAAYLGRELQKAYIALQKGIKYVQDDELEF
jgi:dihydropteroate synthase